MSTRATALTMADAALAGRRSVVRDVVLVIAFGTLMAVFSRISIFLPFTPVPLSGQPLGVLLVGALLGSRRGALALLVYLAEGLGGMPVFSNGASAWTPSSAGVPWIVGPTAGYLWSYPVAAFVVGLLTERGWDRRFWSAAAAMLVGEAAVYAIGLSWLSVFVGTSVVVSLGLLPFVPGDLVKVIIAAAVLPSGWRFLSTFGRRA